MNNRSLSRKLLQLSLFVLALASSRWSHAFVAERQLNDHVRRTSIRVAAPTIARKAFSSSDATSASAAPPRTTSSSSTTRRRPKKTISDRTQQEAASLVQDVIQAAVDAGPRAGPRRTLQAYAAFVSTSQEFLPKLLQPGTSAATVQEQLPAILRTLMERMGTFLIRKMVP